MLTLIGAGCGNNPTTPTAPTTPEPENVTLTVVLPLSRDGVPAVAGATITCLEGCPNRQTLSTDNSGQVTFQDVYPPLLVEARKLGYITRQKSGMIHNTQIVLSHEWPDEAKQAIDQLGLAEKIASGEILLRWGEDGDYFNSVHPNVGGQYVCPTIIIREFEDRDFMVWVLIHEAMHAWQGLKSLNPPCGTNDGYLRSEEGRAWAEARDKDIEEHGLYIGLDNEDWASSLWENQAGFYSYWYWGPETRELGNRWNKSEELEKLYRLAPNRSKYMEDRFGPPPPRR